MGGGSGAWPMQLPGMAEERGVTRGKVAGYDDQRVAHHSCNKTQQELKPAVAVNVES